MPTYTPPGVSGVAIAGLMMPSENHAQRQAARQERAYYTTLLTQQMQQEAQAAREQDAAWAESVAALRRMDMLPPDKRRVEAEISSQLQGLAQKIARDYKGDYLRFRAAEGDTARVQFTNAVYSSDAFQRALDRKAQVLAMQEDRRAGRTLRQVAVADPDGKARRVSAEQALSDFLSGRSPEFTYNGAFEPPKDILKFFADPKNSPYGEYGIVDPKNFRQQKAAVTPDEFYAAALNLGLSASDAQEYTRTHYVPGLTWGARSESPVRIADHFLSQRRTADESARGWAGVRNAQTNTALRAEELRVKKAESAGSAFGYGPNLLQAASKGQFGQPVEKLSHLPGGYSAIQWGQEADIPLKFLPIRGYTGKPQEAKVGTDGVKMKVLGQLPSGSTLISPKDGTAYRATAPYWVESTTGRMITRNVGGKEQHLMEVWAAGDDRSLRADGIMYANMGTLGFDRDSKSWQADPWGPLVEQTSDGDVSRFRAWIPINDANALAGYRAAEAAGAHNKNFSGHAGAAQWGQSRGAMDFLGSE